MQEHSAPKCRFFMANAKLPNRPVLPSYVYRVGVQRDTLRYLENVGAIAIAIPYSAIGGVAMLGRK